MTQLIEEENQTAADQEFESANKRLTTARGVEREIEKVRSQAPSNVTALDVLSLTVLFLSLICRCRSLARYFSDLVLSS